MTINTHCNVPFKPDLENTPTFKSAKRGTSTVMRFYGWTTMLCWVLYTDDTVGLHKFNANGSHRRLQ